MLNKKFWSLIKSERDQLPLKIKIQSLMHARFLTIDATSHFMPNQHVFLSLLLHVYLLHTYFAV